ncbi:MAG: hypothetical protein VKM92_04600 [Cyanobacteriota bacterium]|nr:hypothetical protein [Cyanobacteriota bacterium]
MAAAPAVDHGLRLAALWGAWLLLMLYHVELGLMPLFHGLRVEIESHVAPTRLPQLFWAMLIYFLLPLVAMLLVVQAITAPGSWSAAQGWRAVQFWFSILYSISNGVHLLADMRIPDSRADQVALMVVLSVIGLLINREAWLWWRA